MVNTSLVPVRVVAACYAAITAATLIALVVMAATGTGAATTDAWVHAVIVAVFAGLLLLRARAAGRGNRGALRAVGIIAGVLLVANVVEAALPLFPLWMRVEMIVIAALMAVEVLLVVRAARHAGIAPDPGD